MFVGRNWSQKGCEKIYDQWYAAHGANFVSQKWRFCSLVDRLFLASEIGYGC